MVKLTDVDPGDGENLATIIVSLLQKFTREKRVFNNAESCEEFIQFRLYKILKDSDAQLAKTTGKRLYASQLERCGTSGPYTNLREITKRFRMQPGNYLIIPSCYDAGIKGEFLLRLFTENPISEGDCSILHDHKDDLKKEDIFFSYPKDIDEAFSNWSNFLSNIAPVSEMGKVTSQSTSYSRASNDISHSNSKDLSSNHVKEFNVYKSFNEFDVVDIKKMPINKNLRNF